MSSNDSNDLATGYKLNLVFRGLCPLVPGKKLESTGNLGWAGAFLVNASPANREAFKLDPKLSPHFAFLKFNLSDVEGMTHAPAGASMLRLRSEDLVIVPPDGTHQTLDVAFSGNVNEEPRDGEEELLDWLPGMDDVVPGLGKVHPECFGETERLIARVHMTQGFLHADAESIVTFKGVPVIVRLGERGEPGMQRAVAARFVLDLQCSDGPLRLRLRKFNGSSTRELVFRRPSDGELKIEILNLCAEEMSKLLLGDSADDLGLSDILRPDEDFRWNYIISEDAQDISALRVPVPAHSEREMKNRLSEKGIDPDDPAGGTDAARCSAPKASSEGVPLGSMLQTVSDVSAAVL